MCLSVDYADTVKIYSSVIGTKEINEIKKELSTNVNSSTLLNILSIILLLNILDLICNNTIYLNFCSVAWLRLLICP